MTDYLDRVDLDDSRIASLVDEASLWSARFGWLMLDHLALERDRAVLDLGCGNGFPLFELAHRHGRSGRFVGVDVWEAALRRASGKLESYGLENVHLVRADGSRLPFGADEFDLVVSNVGVNNFADPAAALSECARVAKRGARLALTTNPRGHMADLYDVYREVLRETGRERALDRLDEEEAHRPTRERITAMLGAAGFAPVRAVEDVMRLRYLDGGALLRHSLTRFGFLDGWRSVVPADDEPAVFAALEAKLDERAREKGDLEMLVPMLYLEARRE